MDKSEKKRNGHCQKKMMMMNDLIDNVLTKYGILRRPLTASDEVRC